MSVDVWVYVEPWRHTADEIVMLGRALDDEEWARSTDLPGWTVRDVFAHLAAVEAHLAGEPDPSTQLPNGLPHVRDEFGAFTERGVRLRRERPIQQVIDELARHVATRTEQLRTSPPSDLSERAPATPAAQPWTWETLLRNRVIDLWMHEQDVRRAVGRPGDLDGPGARVTLETYRTALPYILGKRVAPPAGTTVVWEVRGPFGFTQAVAIGSDGRAAKLAEPPGDPDLVLTMDTQSFVMLAGGRRDPASVEVTIDGDVSLATEVLSAMNITP